MPSKNTMNEPVPVTRDLEYLYPPEAIEFQRARFEHLKTRFVERYGRSPLFVARSPGRVNLIGEHIDYSLYEVLPMAIVADVLIAVAPVSRKSEEEEKEVKIYLENLNSQKFKSGEFSVPKEGNIEIDASTLQWTNYFKAGFSGAVDLLRKRHSHFSPCGMEVLVDGTVPAGGGLSSSAAFVCASALATLWLNGSHKVPKKDLVELAIVSERSVGVNSGGMDQAASVFSVRGDAVSISFSPELYAEALPFPKTGPPITFMVAQSFVAADKHVAAPEQYNLRVVECTIAAEVMAAKLGLKLKTDSGPLESSLRGFQNAYYEAGKADQCSSAEDRIRSMLSLTEKYLDNSKGYSREEIASILSMSVEALEQRFMTKFPIRAERFHLAPRARHVFTEALRVQAFKQLLLDPPADAHTVLLPKLGDILNESHASSRDVYIHSCPEIDQMCEIARGAGSYGSRITGAGWGGCSVHLVPKDKVETVKAAWEEKYYRRREPNITKEKLAEAVVVSEPGHGSMM